VKSDGVSSSRKKQFPVNWTEQFGAVATKVWVSCLVAEVLGSDRRLVPQETGGKQPGDGN
jgi:hypothetical protein